MAISRLPVKTHSDSSVQQSGSSSGHSKHGEGAGENAGKQIKPKF